MRGPAAQLAEELRARGEVKGEIALVIAPPSEDEEAGIAPVGAAAADPDEALREDIRAALEEGDAIPPIVGICPLIRLSKADMSCSNLDRKSTRLNSSH